jgi:hypothetical protein
MKVWELKEELEHYHDNTEVRVLRKIQPPARREQIVIEKVLTTCSEFTDTDFAVRYTPQEVHSKEVDPEKLSAVFAIWL